MENQPYPNQSYNNPGGQQYPQNNPYNQSYTSYQPTSDQFYMPERKKPNFIIVSLVLVVLIAAIGLYFVMKPKMISASTDSNLVPNIAQPEAQIPVENNTLALKHSVSISNFKLCDRIESFRCDENKLKVFGKGSQFYAYMWFSTPIYGRDYLTVQEGISIKDKNGNFIYANPAYKYERIDTYDNETNTMLLMIPIVKELTSTVGQNSLEITLTEDAKNEKAVRLVQYEIR